MGIGHTAPATIAEPGGQRIGSLFRQGYLPPWLSGYALIGLVVSGIVPILIPLSMDPKGEVAVGAVVAAFYLGTLAAPLFGSLADRTGTQRVVFIASFPIIAAASAVFGLVDGTVARFVCMLVAGAGAGAAQTTASMFIVEGRPRSEWGERMGWMRLAFGIGQVAGLAVAAWFAHRLEAGWIVVGVIMACGTILGALRLPRIAKAAPSSETAARHTVRDAVLSQFGVFLACWLFAMIGLMTFYNVVPLILRAAFDVDPSTTSLVFLAGSAVGAVFYPVCGNLDHRIGSARLLAIGIGTTLIGFVILASATLLHGAAGAVLGSLALVLVATVYPFQYVGATLLAAEIAPGGEGSAMGLFNSGVAAGAVIGAIVPTFLAQAAGYDSLPMFSLGAMIVSAAFGLPLLRHLRRESPQSFGRN